MPAAAAAAEEPAPPATASIRFFTTSMMRSSTEPCNQGQSRQFVATVDRTLRLAFAALAPAGSPPRSTQHGVDGGVAQRSQHDTHLDVELEHLDVALLACRAGTAAGQQR